MALAKNETDSEMAIAINEAIIEQDEDDVVAYNRLGRGYARGRLVRTRWARLRACARTRSQRGASPSSDASSGKDPELTATAALLRGCRAKLWHRMAPCGAEGVDLCRRGLSWGLSAGFGGDPVAVELHEVVGGRDQPPFG